LLLGSTSPKELHIVVAGDACVSKKYAVVAAAGLDAAAVHCQPV
jgi:hypothetical protein